MERKIKIGMLTLHLKNIALVSKTAFKQWMLKDPFRESAVIAYYAIFSLPGLLVVVVTCAGYFLGREAVNGHLTAQITRTLGAQTAEHINSIVIAASEAKNSLWAAILGVITIIVGATGVFAEFQKSLNTIWEVKTDKAKSGLWHVIRVRLFVRVDSIYCIHSDCVTSRFSNAFCLGSLVVWAFFQFIFYHLAGC